MNPPAGSRKDRFPWRFGFYIVVFLYLAGDLYVFNGPIRRTIDSRRSSELVNAPDQSQWIATVNREPITKRQLEVAVMKHLFRRGKTGEELTEKNVLIVRLAVLQELINDTLIRQYAEGDRFKAPARETDSFVAAFEAQFADAAELETRSEGQKLDPAARREALARFQNEKRWIEGRISEATQVTDEEARAWFDANREEGFGFANPGRFHARHIFISTVLESGPEREARIRDIHQKAFADDADFAALALEYSEDQRTRKTGGDLNWFGRDRMPSKFIEAVSNLQPGEMSEPFQTDIGWHIVELIDQEPEIAVEYEALKPEIVDHIESQRRAAAVQELILRLRKVAAIEFFQDRLMEDYPIQQG